MGIIQRQTIKGSIYSYMGAILGFINLAVLAPRVFTTDQIGLTQVLVSVATIFAQLATLGFNSVTARLFPYFRSNETRHNGFPFLMILVGFVGFILSMIVYLVLRGIIIARNIEKSALFVEYIDLLVPLILFILFFILFDSYIRILYNATFGTFLREILLRVINLVIIILFLLDFISFRVYVYLFIAAFSIPPLLILVLMMVRRQISLKPNLRFISFKLRKEMIDVAVFGVIAGLSGIALMSIDKYMVTEYLGLANAGIYSIAFYFGTMILIPSRALSKISVTFLGESWKKNDRTTIFSIYQKSALNQFIAAGLLLVLIMANLHNIFKFLPSEYAQGRWVIILISLANVLNMLSGVSMFIIGTSRFYRYQNYLMIILIVTVVVTNIIFIPLFGITGAAVASLISTLLFTILKFLVLVRLFNFQPYNYRFIIVIGITAVAFAVHFLIPELNFWIDLIVRSGCITMIYITGLLITRISEDVMVIWETILGKILKK